MREREGEEVREGEGVRREGEGERERTPRTLDPEEGGERGIERV